MGKLRLSEGIDLHYGGITENNVVLTDGNRNVTMATGASAGKFAVMNGSVHASYDFYNDGTSYLNGATTIDANLTVQSGTLTVNGGSTNVVANFVSSDSVAGIKLQDSAGNVELSASGSTFRVQPSGSSAVFTVESGGNTTITGDLTMTQSSGNNILHINSSGGGNPVIYMEDSSRKWGQFVSSTDLYFRDENASVDALILNAGGIATFGNTVEIPAVLRHVGDTDTYLQFTDGEVDLFANGQNTFLTSSGGVVINPLSVSTCDFAAKGDNDSALLYVDASADKVGIGRSDPGYKLDVRGPGATLARFLADTNGEDALVRIIAANYNTEADARLFLGEGDTYGMTVEYDGNANIGYLGMNDNVDPTGSYSKRIQMSRGGTEVAFMAGNVGIGTTSPDRKLTVSGTLGIGIDDYIVHNGDSNSFFGFNGADSWKVRTGGGDRFVVTNDDSYFNNQVGIGKSSPDYKLHILESGVNVGAAYIEDGTSWYRVVPNLGSGGYNPISTAGDIGLIFSTDASTSTDTANGLVIAPHSNNIGGMRIQENGRIGIGENSPDCRVHITHGTKDNTVLKLETYLATVDGATYANYQELVFAAGGSGPYSGIRQYANGWANSDTALAFWTQQHGGSYAERMRIDGDGNVGIGTTNPQGKLDVNGDLYLAEYIYHSGDTNTYIRIQDDSWTFRTGGNDRLTINNGGTTLGDNLAMGGYAIENAGSIAGTSLSINGQQVINSSRQMSNLSTISSGAHTINGSANSNYIIFQVSGSSKGCIGIGDTTASNIHISNSTSSTSGTGIRLTTYTNVNNVSPCYGNGTLTNNLTNLGSSSAKWKNIYAGSNIYADADVVAYSSSDERLKDNLERIQQPIEKIQKISGYEFDWNDNQDTFEGHDIGVVAQEVEKVLPEIVETRENGYKAVKYEKMVALLIEGMKEQQEQIKELQEQVQELSKQK